jgi:hypothetical protein
MSRDRADTLHASNLALGEPASRCGGVHGLAAVTSVARVGPFAWPVQGGLVAVALVGADRHPGKGARPP